MPHGSVPAVIRLTVDGRRVEVPPGSTILDACRKLGVGIPTLCYHPRLPLAGACRVCMVAVEGSRVLVPSCARAAEDGMVVTTQDGAKDARQTVLELLLADHPSPCKKTLVPEGCELENLARAEGAVASRFARTAQPREVDLSNAAIAFDPSACILCFRCVRACDDVQVNEVIGVQGRGFSGTIAFDLGDPMGKSSCVTCGECVQACPTGALVEKTVHALSAPVSPARVDTVCPYCGVGCKITYEVVGNAILRGIGHEEGPANRGRLCVKGRFGFDYTAHRERLTTPLVRREGVAKGPLGNRRVEDVFRPASWDEALDLVARRLATIKDRHGPTALAGFASAKCTNEDNYVFQKWVRACLGTPHIDHCTRLCHASSVYALQTALGTGSMTNAIDDIADAEVMLVTGSNTTENHPVP
ncbi:MAG TPA: 2Fe-2S iron-sulfur cluster-binding protein, partial [Candidatus Thermoplasmatota archaeon]|nr:2Fe-2S iron-sulfur cluster-binding protein [Candidatus Thermoplasmatota archaeon]